MVMFLQYVVLQYCVDFGWGYYGFYRGVFELVVEVVEEGIEWVGCYVWFCLVYQVIIELCMQVVVYVWEIYVMFQVCGVVLFDGFGQVVDGQVWVVELLGY